MGVQSESMDTQPPTPGTRDGQNSRNLERSISNLTPGSLMESRGALGSLERSRSTLTPESIQRKHPPTSLYISMSSELDADYGADLSHLSEIQEQITRVQQTEVFKQQRAAEQELYTAVRTSLATSQESSRELKQQTVAVSQQQLSSPTLNTSIQKNKSDKSSLGRSSIGKQSSSSGASSELQAGAAVGVKKKDKKSSLSSLFSVFTRKKSSKGEKKKSSIGALLESTGSILNPEIQKTIIDSKEMEEEGEDEFRVPPSPSPYTEWRVRRERSDLDQSNVSHVSQTYIHIPSPDTPVLGLSRGTTPDPDYDNMSLMSSPRAPRIKGFDGNSSDTSCDDYGRYHTTRSTVSDYRLQTRNSLTGLGRGISPSPSEPPISRRAPSTESFFGVNGANLVSNNTSQIWYQRYKHSSFSSSNQNTFGEPTYGAFDGRITNIRGENPTLQDHQPGFNVIQVQTFLTRLGVSNHIKRGLGILCFFPDMSE